ncbi:MAG: hypothetical protein ABI620_00685, partial [Chloroflexota bacterium]
GAQWIPAVPVLLWLAIAMPFAAAASPGIAILNAHGRSQDVLGFTVLWMVSTWVLTIPAVVLFGWVGFGVANALVTLSAPLFFRRVQRYVSFAVWVPIGRVLLAVIAAWTAHLAAQGTIATVAIGSSWALASAASLLVFVVVWLALSAKELRLDWLMVSTLFGRRRTPLAAA